MKRNLLQIIWVYCALAVSQANFDAYGQTNPKKNPIDTTRIKTLNSGTSNGVKAFLNVMPPSADAAALGRFGEFPVSLHSGLPSVSIPIYEIQSGALRLPISLNYHASGVRVNDVSSSVGLGWSLSAGGAITRSVNNIPDEHSFGILNYPPPVETDAEALGCYVGRIAAIGTADGQPDSYFYNFPEGSGRFIYANRTRTNSLLTTPKPVTIPYRPLQIEDSQGNNSFVITSENGTRYEFGNAGAVETSFPNSSRYGSFNTTWYLKRVISANQIDEITINYTSVQRVFGFPIWPKTLVQDQSFGGSIVYSYEQTLLKTDINTVYVSEIIFKNGKVTFDYNNDRADQPGAKRLSRVGVYRNNDGNYEELKHFDLSQSYFETSDGYTQTDQYLQSNHAANSPYRKRLKLNQVTEVGGDGTSLPAYEFNYHEDVPLPIWGAFAQDYWGFYNGQSNNQKLLLWDTDYAQTQAPSLSFGANRSGNFNYAIAGTLKKIKYPTRGHTDFVFEPAEKFQNGNIVHAGGIRVKSIINYAENTRTTRKDYEYNESYFTNTLFSGDFNSLDFRHSMQYEVNVGTGTDQGGNNCDLRTNTQTTYPENMSFSLGTNSGSSLSYLEVTERQTDANGNNPAGKRVLKYLGPFQDATPSPFPYFQVSAEHKRGLLVEERTEKITPAGSFIIDQTLNTYEQHFQNLKTRGYAARVAKQPYIGPCVLLDVLCGSGSEFVLRNHLINYSPIDYDIDTYFLSSTEQRKFNGTSNDSYPLTTTTMFQYGKDTHQQITQKTVTAPNESSQTTNYRYPHEFANGGNVYQTMVNRHIFSPLIEEEVLQDNQFLKRTRTNYNHWYTGTYYGTSGFGFLAPISVETQEAGGPLIKTLVMGELMDNAVEMGYDLRARPIVYSERNGLTTRLYWWDNAGKKDLLQSKTVGNLFDNYDYKPLAGLSYHRDQSGLGSDYVYDGLGRLALSRDQNGRIKQQFSYQYATSINEKNTIVSKAARVETTDAGVLETWPNAQTQHQHLDGLGRLTQRVLGRNTPNANDLITQNVAYDAYGRVGVSWLPMPTLGYQNAYWDTFNAGFYGDSRPFTETQYEQSPAQRPTTVFGAGANWYPAHPVGMNYAAATIQKVAAGSNGFYFGSLVGVEILKQTDEQGNHSSTYQDYRGRMVRKETSDDNGGLLTTKYVYDAFDRLKYVLMPQLGNLQNTTIETDVNFLQNVFGYSYDNLGRLFTKQVPGGGETQLVYDRFDRVVLEQTASQRQASKWSFNKYDALNRVVLRGEKTDGRNRATLQAEATNSGAAHHETRINYGLYYSLGQAYPAVDEADVRAVYYFDNYFDWVNPASGFDAATAYHPRYFNTTGLPTGGRVRSQTDGSWIVNTVYYDNQKRPIQTFLTHHLGGTDREETKYDFVGNVLANRHSHQRAGQTTAVLQSEYDYDHANRKTACYQTTNGQARQKIAAYTYDEVGRLTQKKLMPDGTYTTGGTTDYITRPPNPNPNGNDVAAKAVFLLPGVHISAQTGTYSATINPNATGGISISGLQTIDYQYHIRGGMRGINSPQTPVGGLNTAEGDLFSYQLDYETGTPAATGYFDGNIGKQTWNNGTAQRSYSYNYDAASRLKSAVYSGVNGEDYSIPNMNYDKNGNITNLQRRGRLAPPSGAGGAFGLMDNLNYSYNGNRLSQITDAVSGSYDVDFVQRGGANYDFWPDGSLKSDANEQISNINYDTFLQQPTQVQLTDGRTINYYYDGGGKLLKTIYSNGEIWEFGNGMIYKNSQPYQLSIPEGRATYNAPSGGWGLEFDYKDHLGNTRVSFKANGNQLEKVAETAFDPWGVVLNGIGQTNSFQNRFEMQGKESEKTFGLNRINFGARTMNPTTGVFDRLDRFADKYHNLSPYSAFGGNPLMFTDMNGDSLVLFKNGTYTSTIDDGKEEINGFNQESTVDKDGNETFTGGQSFSFNDYEDDMAGIKSGALTLRVVNDDEIRSIMTKSGVMKQANRESQWSFIERESRPLGDEGILSDSKSSGYMDYQNFTQRNFNSLNIVNGVAYNNPDYGNFLWGQGGKQLGFSYSTLRVSSHVNNAFNSRSDNPTIPYRILDSSGDQRAIKNGYNYWIKKPKGLHR